jgi:hypothetical protein
MIVFPAFPAGGENRQANGQNHTLLISFLTHLLHQ